MSFSFQNRMEGKFIMYLGLPDQFTKWKLQTMFKMRSNHHWCHSIHHLACRELTSPIKNKLSSNQTFWGARTIPKQKLSYIPNDIELYNKYLSLQIHVTCGIYSYVYINIYRQYTQYSVHILFLDPPTASSFDSSKGSCDQSCWAIGGGSYTAGSVGISVYNMQTMKNKRCRTKTARCKSPQKNEETKTCM